MVALIQFLKEGSTRISTPSRVPEPMQARPPCQLTRFQKRPSSIATATPGRKAPTMVDDNELTFSYRLRPGVAQNMNACFLMKKMGIAVTD